MSKAAPPPALILRTAAVWGTTVMALRDLSLGNSFELGEGPDAALPKPDNGPMSDMPIRAVGGGWELDARGATGGVLYMRGRKEDPAQLAEIGAPIPILPGDYGLLQYGRFSVFFQFAHASPRLATRRSIDWALIFAFVFAVIAVGGALALIWSITTPEPIPKPLELTSTEELAKQLNIEVEPPEPPKVGQDEKGQGIKDAGAKDKKEQGGGKKNKDEEGKLGRQGDRDHTQQTGEIAHGLGGMAEALSSDVGQEVQKTLGTISSVAEALGGLRSNQIVLGQGTGTGLRGGGSGGGGDTDGVPFGAGTLDTGWGAGRGGGFGSGAGGPGGKGTGGPGAGGDGTGKGAGTGEHKVTGKDAPRAGQGLSENQVARVVMSRLGAFRACYESALAADPTMRGTVGVTWSITPGGTVSAANIGRSSLNNARVEGCVLRLVRRLQFPTADKPTGPVSWPFIFNPTKK